MCVSRHTIEPQHCVFDKHTELFLLDYTPHCIQTDKIHFLGSEHEKHKLDKKKKTSLNDTCPDACLITF